MSYRSASTPPHTDKNSVGPNCKAMTMPTASALPSESVQYQPVLGDALHPRADQRNDLSGSPKAVVAVVERGKHAGIGVSGHPTILPLE